LHFKLSIWGSSFWLWASILCSSLFLQISDNFVPKFVDGLLSQRPFFSLGRLFDKPFGAFKEPQD